MPDVFLSYSREDQSTARRFAEMLEREGFTVWWDQSLHTGENYDRTTEAALRSAKAVVVLWSKTSVDSQWVRAEATTADRRGTLMPVMIEPCERPVMFELKHTADLSGWRGERGAAAWVAFVADMRRQVGSEDGSEKSVPAAATRGEPGFTLRRAIVAVAALLGAGLLWYFLDHRPQLADREPAAARSASAAPVSVAVLPFRDMSQNHDQEYFADGVTEEILNTLSGIRGLKVTARNSAFAFKGKDLDQRTVGEQLGVQHILEGSIRKDGDKLRITAQLIDVGADAQLWSRTYDRPLQDIFAVQEDIARSVAEALQVSLGVGFGNQIGMTRDVQAYDAYLAAGGQAQIGNLEVQRRYIALLEFATKQDPAFAEAWARLAGAYLDMRALVTADAEVWQQKADTALETARRLAPELARLHYMLGERSTGRTHWSEAAEHYQRVSLATPDTQGNQWTDRVQARPLLRVGRTREALTILEQERARDPLFNAVSVYLGVAYSTAGNFPAAVAEFNRLKPSSDPVDRYGRWRASMANALAMGDRDAIRSSLDARPDGGTPELVQLETRLKSLLANPGEALTLVRQQARDPSTPGISQLPVAQWLAYFGDEKEAIESLRKGFAGGAANNASFNLWYPNMSKARALPEFKQLLRDFGFVDYWRQYGWGDFCKPVGENDFECH